MSRKRKILNILGMLLGAVLMFASTMMIALEYIYYVGDKIYLLVTIQDKLILFLFQLCWIALGMFLICRGVRDFRRYGRYQLFQSVCAGREYVEAFEQIAVRMCDRMEIHVFQDLTALEVLMAQNSRKGA